MEGGSFWIAAIAAALALGIGKGGVPAITSLAVPILSLVISPIAAAGLLLPVYIVADLFALGLYRHSFDRRVLKIAMLTMPIGVGIGWATAHIIPEAMVTILVGVIGVSYVLRTLWRGKTTDIIPIRPSQGGFWCAVAGFTSFVSHSGAPPWQVWTLRLGLTRDMFVGTSVIAFAYVNAVKLVPYAFLGQLGVSNLKIAALLTIPVILGVWIGARVVKRIPEALFFKIVNGVLFLISLRLIWAGVSALV